ncbi:MAG: hypothetical protein H0U74_05410 [Bradymonadaceae bacterium]|nr:hypothetical protein [Lujinxingiaceae bacterium]
MDAVIREEMTLLVQREKKLEQEKQSLENELPTWQQRVRLAEEKGISELADQARERFVQLRARHKEVGFELEVIAMDKSVLRRRSRQPSGQEVERAEALLESFRQSGLVDPDEAALESEFRELQKAEDLSKVDKGGDEG